MIIQGDVAEREQEGAEAGAGGQHQRGGAPRPETVERDADGELRQREGDEPGARSRRELGLAHAEFGGERRRQHRQEGPVELRQHVSDCERRYAGHEKLPERRVAA